MAKKGIDATQIVTLLLSVGFLLAFIAYSKKLHATTNSSAHTPDTQPTTNAASSQSPIQRLGEDSDHPIALEKIALSLALTPQAERNKNRPIGKWVIGRADGLIRQIDNRTIEVLFGEKYEEQYSPFKGAILSNSDQPAQLSLRYFVPAPYKKSTVEFLGQLESIDPAIHRLNLYHCQLNPTRPTTQHS